MLNDLATRRLTFSLDGYTIDQWNFVEVVRDLGDIAGSFRLDFRDGTRSLSTWPYSTPIADLLTLDPGQKATLAIDGETLLTGYVDDINPDAGDQLPRVTVTGRDVTQDLVDCAPDPRGRHEYRNISLTDFAAKLCQPFKIAVRADVDVSPVFEKCVVEAGETALSAIEKYARQRAVLVTSDGVGTLVLTRSGQTRAPADLAFPGNIVHSGGGRSFRERFSDYFVKGQAEKNGGKRGKSPALDATAEPLDAPPETGKGTSEDDDAPEGAGALVMGHARDSEIQRWRPTVAISRTQARTIDAQRQAEWMMRTRRGKGDRLDYTLVGWRANGGLWKPNTLAFVADRFQRFNRDMLVAGVTYSYGTRGERARLRVVGPEAYDLLPEADRRANKGRGADAAASSGKLDSTAYPLGTE